MPDRENAIKGLKEIAEYMEARADVADVGKVRELFDGWYRAAADALALLREQEAVSNAVEKDKPLRITRCGGCGIVIVYRGRDVCPYCGKAVEWDETD